VNVVRISPLEYSLVMVAAPKHPAIAISRLPVSALNASFRDG
jgi:hypothetical protein